GRTGGSAPGALGVLDRLKGRAGARLSGPVVTLDEPAPDPTAVRTPDRPSVISGDLVVRTGPDMRLRTGGQVPLLVDLAHLYVFDHYGRRICPLPQDVPGLDG
ncbi:sugar ABC transporter ATP-binding protein, partial [Streptomyces sp. SID2119]|nr:sugar ABC transporter ATP-binding protein [Streptomyces sp. SID2119]